MTARTSIRGVELVWDCSPPLAATGFGPAPVIWAHGGNSSRRDEDELGAPRFDHWPTLSARSLIRYDARGHGESGDADQPSEFQWNELAADQLALADALGVTGYVTAGRSLGAVTAIHAAVQAPDRVERLVLANPPTAWERRDAQANRYLALAERVEAEGTGFLIKAMESGALAEPLRDQPHVRQQQVANLERRRADCLVTFLRGTAGTNLPDRKTVARIDAPTLVLAWTGDPVHPVEVAEELADLLPNATLHLSSTWEDVRAWVDLMADFIS